MVIWCLLKASPIGSGVGCLSFIPESLILNPRKQEPITNSNSHTKNTLSQGLCSCFSYLSLSLNCILNALRFLNGKKQRL